MKKNIRKQSTLVAVATLATVAFSSSLSAQQAKNVILMISDGAGFNTFKVADLYSGETPVYQGFTKYAMQTYSASRPVAYNSAAMFNGTDATFAMSNYTDSASAATAMYTGVKNYDGEVNWSVDDQPLTTYFEHAANAGRSIGAITSVEYSHATPAAVYGHNSSRNNYAAIATEGTYGSNPLDGSVSNSGSNPLAGNNGSYDSGNYNDKLTVLMGAGHGDYDDNGVANVSKTNQYVGGDATWSDIIDGTAPNGWSYVQEKSDFEAIANGTLTVGKLLGVAQANSTLQQGRSGTVDPSNPSGLAFNDNVPTLETMTKAGLQVLGTDSNGFAVMIEGGAVDWAGHANQIGQLIEEQMDFNKSVQVVVDWVNLNDPDWSETLLIVTADHETGNLWGNGSYTDVNTNGVYDAGIDTFNGYQEITATGENVLTDVQFLSGNHTNSLVPLYVKGAGSELFANYVVGTEDIATYYGENTAGFGDNVPYIDNTSIFSVMTEASAIPEPSTYAGIFGSLALVLAVIRRRKIA
jgi:alkaline phosphatase